MSEFKIAAAQVPSIRGEITTNLAMHAGAMRAAGDREISVLTFPELSLTGYEPELASELAITAADARLEPLRRLARQHRIVAVIGAPLKKIGSGKPAIGAIVITESGATLAYHKMHLGGSEPNYFSPGDRPMALDVGGQKVGLAICADASQASHPQAYAQQGANIYAAGVFLNAEWYATDMPRLASYAAGYRMLTVMANQGASSGTYKSVGKSAIWSPDGALLAEAEGTESALVVATNNGGSWSGEVIQI